MALISVKINLKATGLKEEKIDDPYLALQVSPRKSLLFYSNNLFSLFVLSVCLKVGGVCEKENWEKRYKSVLLLSIIIVRLFLCNAPNI